MKYPLATETWTSLEKEAAKSVIDSGMCTMGEITKEFESKFAEKFGAKYAVFSNSGSSANLLAVAALFYKNNGLKPGDEVIVPAVSWSTTYYPFHQYGLKLVFVDVDPITFNIDPEEIRKAITPKTKVIAAVNLLGVPCDFDELRAICAEHDLFLFEDNCESMGAKYGKGYCGTIGDIGTFSTFFSHHICTVEGGVTVTNDEELYHIMLSIRSHGWTRHLPDVNHVCNKTGNSFHDSFNFVLPGYNLRNNDIFAAIGLIQLEKISQFVDQRRKNRDQLVSKFSSLLDNYRIQDSANKESHSSWFGFGFVCKNDNRDEVVSVLQNQNIDCRPIVAGNFCKNPVVGHMDHKIIGDLPIANEMDKRGFFIGNNSEDLTKEIDYFVEIMESIKT